MSKNIEQNTDGFLLIKSYNQQEKQIEKFKNINSKMYKADYEIGVAKNNISRIIKYFIWAMLYDWFYSWNKEIMSTDNDSWSIDCFYRIY